MLQTQLSTCDSHASVNYHVDGLGETDQAPTKHRLVFKPYEEKQVIRLALKKECLRFVVHLEDDWDVVSDPSAITGLGRVPSCEVAVTKKSTVMMVCAAPAHCEASVAVVPCVLWSPMLGATYGPSQVLVACCSRQGHVAVASFFQASVRTAHVRSRIACAL